MKFDKIMETSQSRPKTHLEDIMIDNSKIIKDNTEIPLDEIVPFKDVDNDEQPFTIDESEMTALQESIEEVGQLTPATVRQLDNGKYELLSGHKRFIAMSRLGAKTLLCRVCSFSDKEAFIVVCHGNIQRKGEKPTEICNMYNGYKKRFGNDMSVTEISKFFGISAKTLYRCIHINNLIDELKPLVDSGLLTVHAVEIVDVLSAEQQQVLHFYLKKSRKSLTPKAAKRIIELADMNNEFTAEDIDRVLNPPKIRKHYDNPLYNDIYNTNPTLIQGMKEKEIDDLIYMLLEQHMNNQHDRNTADEPIKWDGEAMLSDVDTAIVRISRKYDISRMIERNVSPIDIASQLKDHCAHSGYGSPDDDYDVWCTSLGMQLRYKNRVLNVNGATVIELSWRQIAKELIRISTK